jgi:hypothetical protein
VLAQAKGYQSWQATEQKLNSPKVLSWQAAARLEQHAQAALQL